MFPWVVYDPVYGGPRSDVYAAAALCYGLLTGREYARDCCRQYEKLPRATRREITDEAAGCGAALGHTQEPHHMELLMAAQNRGHVRPKQVMAVPTVCDIVLR